VSAGASAPSVPAVREAKNPDEIVTARLHAVLAFAAEHPPDRPASPGPEPAAAAVRPPDAADFTDMTPLHWSDIVPSWPDGIDVDRRQDLPPGNDPSVPESGSFLLDELGRPERATGFAAGAAPIRSAVQSETTVLPTFSDEPGTTRRSVAPWTEVRDEDVQPASPPVLTAAGAFDPGPPITPTAAVRGRLAAFDPGRRGVKALAAVAVVVVLIAAVLAWRARPQVDPVPVPAIGVPAGTGKNGSEDGAGAVPATGRTGASAGSELVVAVGGKVRKPGLVHLPPGARVADALQAAGGPDPGVDVAPLNLARKVVDGELIMVGVTPAPGAAGNGPGAAPAGAPAGGLVNLNTATLADLDRLPGVGPVLAQRILDARQAQGGFKAVSDLRKVDGIGDARYEQLKDLVIV
jgi:competence protein ComEA